MNKSNYLKILNALSDPTRLEVMICILKNDGIQCSNILNIFELSQPTMSHHLSKLIDAELIIKKKTGVSNSYFVNLKVVKNYGVDKILRKF